MSTREARQVYRIHAMDLNEVNRLLGRMADRFDELEGRRGTPEFHADLDLGGYRARNAGTPTAGADVYRLEDSRAGLSSTEGRLDTIEAQMDAFGVAVVIAAQDDGTTTLHGMGDCLP